MALPQPLAKNQPSTSMLEWWNQSVKSRFKLFFRKSKNQKRQKILPIEQSISVDFHANRLRRTYRKARNRVLRHLRQARSMDRDSVLASSHSFLHWFNSKLVEIRFATRATRWRTWILHSVRFLISNFTFSTFCDAFRCIIVWRVRYGTTPGMFYVWAGMKYDWFGYRFLRK